MTQTNEHKRTEWAERFRSPKSATDWIDNIFRWVKRNFVAGGIAIFISFGISIMSINDISVQNSDYVYANLLSLLVLSMSAVLVNTDFENWHMHYFERPTYWIRTLGNSFVAVGLLTVVLITPSTPIVHGALDRNMTVIVAIIVIFISIIIAFSGHLVSVLANGRAFDDTLSSYAESVEENAQQTRKKAKQANEVDGIEI